MRNVDLGPTTEEFESLRKEVVELRARLSPRRWEFRVAYVDMADVRWYATNATATASRPDRRMAHVFGSRKEAQAARRAWKAVAAANDLRPLIVVLRTPAK